MSELNPISRKQLIRSLKKFGFDGPYSGGKHQYMIKDNLRLTIPNPHQKDISPSLLARILRQAKITKEDWEN
ncbi:MAG: type II toxin-antitoxin system HicA family toxin [Cyanobacteria bacterium]|nr:type II toxin-antitoxin system HicA family toxin [Cyanobacteria bacterium CG_2015-16_32_12]NCO77446.1 type II toxin-antitoxin system HicA family toxin [Cyanobacteria bacterium CG_2015-22_32_23]NCQ42302.1 type II toxin-antitoxin system HicA family toxin [Cyanobacteria bacterium CG_2015-04_32_10]NCS84500.1 type II toxin-antitoxin system HicA family toxin [Cyanobacteria bacterium CG_2015-02_32_10]